MSGFIEGLASPFQGEVNPDPVSTPSNVTATLPPAPPPSAPIMGSVHETYLGSGVYNFKLGGKPLADWTGLDPDPDSLTKENPKRFRPVNVTKDKYIAERATAIKTVIAINASTVDPLNELWDKAKECGLDTYLYLPSPSDSTKMLSVIDHYPVFIADIDATEKIATALKIKFDENDNREDSTLHTVVKGSCSKDILDKLQYSLKDSDSAAMLLMRIMNRAVNSSSAYYQKVKQCLKELQPKQFPGENIESMGLKAMQYVKILEGSNRLDPDDFQRYLGNYMKVSCTTSVYYHQMTQLVAKYTTAVRDATHLSQDKTLDVLASKELDPQSIIDKATSWYKVEFDNEEWTAAKVPSTSQTPSSRFSANLLSSDGGSNVDNTSLAQKIIALLKLDSSAMDKHVKNGGVGKSKPAGAKGNCRICNSPDHWARDCPLRKNGAGQSSGNHASRKGNSKDSSDKIKSWRKTPPASGASETTQKNGRTFYWCAKCRRWTASHGTAGHTGRSGSNDRSGSNGNGNGSSNVNLLQFDPGAWCTFIDSSSSIVTPQPRYPPREPPMPSVSPPFSLISIALLGAVIVGMSSILSSMVWELMSSSILTHIASTFDWIASMSQTVALHVWNNFHEIYLPALAPMSWFLVGFGVAFAFHRTPSPKRVPRNVRRYHDKQQRRWKKKYANYRRNYNSSARTAGLHRSYPLRLRNEGTFRTKAPTHRQRKLHSALHDFLTFNRRRNAGRKSAFSPPHCVYTTSKPSKDDEYYRHGRDEVCGLRKRKCSIKLHNKVDHGWKRKCSIKLHNKVNRGWKGDYYVNEPHNNPTRLSRSQEEAINTIVNEVNLLSVPDLLRNESNIALVLRAAHQAPGRFQSALGESNSFPIIWDSGASVTITHCKDDFISFSPSKITKLNGVGSGLEVKGEGTVAWTFTDDYGGLRTIKVKAYYAPKSKVRLLSTAGLLQHYEDESINIQPHLMRLSGISNNRDRAPITVRVHQTSNLPMSIAYRQPESRVPSVLLSTISTVHSSNLNLSEPQKELLRWHYRFGHVDIRRVQFVMRKGVLATSPSKRRLHALASKIQPLPKCAACQFGKQVRRTTPGTRTRTVPAGKISRDTLFPGQEVSVDHFVCSTKGRLWTSRGKSRDQDLYHGGALFVDQASKYIHVENQVSLSTHATLQSKLNFEQLCADVGVVVQKYLSDGASCFTSKEFNDHLSVFRQIIRFAGAGAHHHNPAEREIRTIMSIARTMMLHASIHWPEMSEPELWPMAVSYAVYTWNHLPNPVTGLSPSEIFTKSKWSDNNFQNFHVWGCPVYVLDKEIADGKKIPKWRPRSQRMMFVGFSPHHASCVPMVLNPQTGTITPQFHVVFDDWFDTVTTNVDDLPDYNTAEWYKMFGDSEYQYVLDDDDDFFDAPNPTPSDLHHHDRFISQQNRTASAMPPNPPLNVLPPPSVPPPTPSGHPVPSAPPMPPQGPPPLDMTDTKPPMLRNIPLDASVERERLSPDDSWARSVGIMPGQQLPSSLPPPLFSPRPRIDSSFQREQPIAQREQSMSQRELSKPPRKLDFSAPQSIASVPEPIPVPVPSPAPTPSPTPTPTSPPPLKSKPIPVPPRRSTRQRKAPETYNPSAYAFACLPPRHIMEPSVNFAASDTVLVEYSAEKLAEDRNIIGSELPTLHPFVYASNRQDPDIYSYDEVVAMEDSVNWHVAAIDEIKALESYDTWSEDLRSNVPDGTKIIPGTWVFRMKRYPDGSPKKRKARFCVRGDLQDITNDETYAPLVSFPTVRLFLALVTLFGWVALSIDFDNAFVQARLTKPVWIHFPRGFGSCRGDTHLKCLKLHRSLYGMATAPRLFYQHLFGTLIDDLKFTPCDLDPCFLFRKDCMMIVYCDDVAIAAKDVKTINKVIKSLRDEGLELTVEGPFEDYLSVKYSNLKDGMINMTQSGLIEKVLETADMSSCNPCHTPANVGALATDPNGEPIKEKWNYRSIIGMLIYLSTNTRPDITFAVSQVARYGNNPKQSHARAVKKILRYLRGTSNFGIRFKPKDKSSLLLDLYVDADFAGRHHADDQSDRNSARSRTGFIISLNGCPVIWRSALQTSLSQSTGQAEYCALSESLRQAIPIRNMLVQLASIVDIPAPFTGEVGPIRAWEDNSAALSLANNHRLTSRNRWYNVQFHFFWQHVDDGTVSIKKVETTKQGADYLTKGLDRETFEACRMINQGW